MTLLSIRVPFVVTQRPHANECMALTLRDICTVHQDSTKAIAAAAKRVQATLRGKLPDEIVRYGVSGEVACRVATIDISPRKSGANAADHDRPDKSRRDAFSLTFALVTWSCGGRLIYAASPAFDEQMIANTSQEAEQLLLRRIRLRVEADLANEPRGVIDLLTRTGGQSHIHWQSIDVEAISLAEQSMSQIHEPVGVTPTLRAVATRWAATKMRTAYGRKTEVKNLIAWLTSDDPQSVILIGKSGVGKTAIVHQAVRQLHRTGQTRKFYSTDGPRLIAGQCGFGMLQEQCLKMASEASRVGAIVHLGNLTQLIESGKNNGSGGCASLLAPRIAAGALIAIVEATPEEYSLAQRTEPRLMALLEPFHVDEPDVETNRMILMESVIGWGENQRSPRPEKPLKADSAETPIVATIEPGALFVLDRLHRQFPTDAAMPGRPLAFLATLLSERKPVQTIAIEDVYALFSRQSGLPRFLIDPASRPDLKSIQKQLDEGVIGQPHATEVVVDTIAMLATWIARGDRPLASLLLIGPTGVGKTETAKAIARLIYNDPGRMVRIDFSEFGGPDAVSRLIGDSRRGEGVLTGAIRAQPFSLLLFDEFEKAHRSVFDLLLQLLGEGRLTDSQGRLADFRNCIVLMTSNLGVESFRSTPLGLVQTRAEEEQRLEKHFEQQVRAFMRPELYNRIDRILSYRALMPDTIKRIAAHQLSMVEARDGMLSRGGTLRLTDEAMDLLVTKGYEPQYGARPLARAIERDIVAPLAEAIAKTQSQTPTPSAITANVSADSDRMVVAIEAKTNSQEIVDRCDHELLMDATRLRRHFQSLMRSVALTTLQNTTTTRRRALDREFKAAKTESDKSKVFQSLLAGMTKQVEDFLERVNVVGSAIASLERQIATAFYTQSLADVPSLQASVVENRESLFGVALDVLYERRDIDGPITLIAMANDLALFRECLDAYAELATRHGWTLKRYAIIPGDGLEEAIDFKRLGYTGDESDVIVTHNGKGEEELFKVVPLDPKRWLSVPLSSIQRLAIEISGPRSLAMLADEAGTHILTPADARDRKSAFTMRIYVHEHSLAQTQPDPPWLPGPGFDSATVPVNRRHFDFVRSTLVDYYLGEETRCRTQVAIHAADAIQRSLEKRIFSLLEEET